MSRHRFDPFSFVAGAIAVGVAVAVLSGELTISLLDLRVAGPVLLLLLGLTLLLGGGRDRSVAEAPAAPAAPVGSSPAEGDHGATDGESRDDGDDAGEDR